MIFHQAGTMVRMTAIFMIFPSFFIFQKGKNFNKASLHFMSPAERPGGWIEAG